MVPVPLGRTSSIWCRRYLCGGGGGRLFIQFVQAMSVPLRLLLVQLVQAIGVSLGAADAVGDGWNILVGRAEWYLQITGSSAGC